jgi:hypothetical protein
MRAIARQEVMAALSSGGSLSSMSPGTVPFNSVIRPFVTDLPVAPTDGDEIRFLADADLGVVWHLRYRDKAPSDYRWEFIGGSSLVDYAQPDGTVADTSYVAATTEAGPDVIVPLAGEYRVTFGGSAVVPSTDILIAAPSLTGTAASDTNGARVDPNDSSAEGVFFRQLDITVTTPDDTVSIHYRTTAGNSATVRNRSLIIIPVRVGRP